MANPTCTASLNKSAYAVGETMTLTVSYSDPDTQSMAVTIGITDSAGNTGSASVNALIDPSTITVTSTPARTWVKQSDTGSVAVFTAAA